MTWKRPISEKEYTGHLVFAFGGGYALEDVGLGNGLSLRLSILDTQDLGENLTLRLRRRLALRLGQGILDTQYLP